MDKKRLVKSLPPEDLKGFEEFIDSQPGDTNFLPKIANKKEASFEHFTFLTNDAERLNRIRDLLTDKLPFAHKFSQGNQLVHEQREEILILKKKLFEMCDKEDSPYRRSLAEIFDLFFDPPKS